VTIINIDHPSPPAGVIPLTIWKEQRLASLSHAINEYVSGGFIAGEYGTQVLAWCDELSSLLAEFQ
jgi:hypothetical protein